MRSGSRRIGDVGEGARIIQGDHNVVVEPNVVRSAYLQQVRRIAPDELLDRNAELSELSAFCTREVLKPYAWWRGDAWAGKSALISWFVLHPPAGVRVVSFFVTSRFAGQSDRVAFIDVVLEQLAELLGQAMPAYLTEATRDAHLLAMLDASAVACRIRRERLVLVVDGLDEDRGVTAGPDAYSIAALLPVKPDAGLRIVVTGRPNPPLPTDVPPNHPLRDSTIVRNLTRSPHAQSIKVEAQHELKRILHASPAEQDLLGLVAAAGGGLSGRDLAELTGWETWEIEEHLHTVSGRTYRTRVGRWRHTPVYVLAHEELQKTAAEFLGASRLDGYRQRLHVWADGYGARGWPAGTPEYLLLGYYRMLQATRDLPRMVAYATDQARHDRMLDVSGGDTAAVTEIVSAQDAILALPDPDLLAMARLAIHRDGIAQRNANIPTDLPAVWATFGQLIRAEALAGAIGDPDRQAEALVELVPAVAQTGDLDRARALAGRAERVAHSITDLFHQATLLADLQSAVANMGDIEHAEALVNSIADPKLQMRELASLARLVAARGDTHQARTLAERAEILAGAINDVEWQARMLAMLSKAVADIGDRDRAHTLAHQAEALVGTIVAPNRQAEALALLAKTMADIGEFERAEILAGSIDDVAWKADVLTNLAGAVADTGDLVHARSLVDRAEALVSAIADSDRHVEVQVALAGAMVETGQSERATALANAITKPEARVGALLDLAKTMADTGHRPRARALADRAEAQLDTIRHPRRQVDALLRLANVVAETGDLDRAGTLADRAERLARSITDPRRRARQLLEVSKAVADTGDRDRAVTLASRASVFAARTTDPEAVAELVTAMIQAGDLHQPERLIDAITDPESEVRALCELTRAVADAGDCDRARMLAGRAELIAGEITDQGAHVRAMHVLANAVAETGDFERAQCLVSAITDLAGQAGALSDLARTAVKAGQPDRARSLLDQAVALTESITDTDAQAAELAGLARAAANTSDPDRAWTLATGAEALARRITDPWRQASALNDLAAAMACVGDYDRAEALAGVIAVESWQVATRAQIACVAADAGDIGRAAALISSIPEPAEHGYASTALAQAVAQAGDLQRAEEIARSIPDWWWQAQALTDLVKLAEAPRDRRLVALTLRLAHWTIALDALARVQPEVLTVIADELLKRTSNDESGSL